MPTIASSVQDLALNMMVSFAICVLLVAVCIWRRILSRSGNIAAFTMGMLIGVLGDFTWLLALIAFLGISVGVTKFRFKEKPSRPKKPVGSWTSVKSNY